MVVRPRSSAPRSPASGWPLVLLFGCAVLPGVLLGCLRWNLDLWDDEVYTLYFFASRPAAEIVSDYSAPNNHVLYSLLIRPFWLWSNADSVLRLPSLVLLAATLVGLFRLALRLAGPPAALLGTTFLGLTQMFLVHAVQIRGYSLSMALTVWLMNLAAAPAGGAGTAGEPRPGRPAGWLRGAAIVLFGAALLYTIPTNALVAVPLAAWSIAWAAVRARRPPAPTTGAIDSHTRGPRASRPERSGAIAAAAAGEAALWLAAAGLAAACYWPIWGPLLETARHGAEGGRAVAITLLFDFLRAATYDAVPLVAIGLAGAGVWAYGFARGQARGGWLVPSLVATMLVVPLVLVAMTRMTLFVRNLTPLLPALALGLGWAWSQLPLCPARRVPPDASAGVIPSRGLKQPAPAERASTGLPPAGSPVAMGWLLASWLVLVGVMLPALVSYPRRLNAARQGAAIQDGYFNYYAADYHPRRLVARVVAETNDQSPQAVCRLRCSEWDYRVLVHYLRRSGALERFLIGPRVPRPEVDAGVPASGTSLASAEPARPSKTSGDASGPYYEVFSDAAPGPPRRSPLRKFGYFELWGPLSAPLGGDGSTRASR